MRLGLYSTMAALLTCNGLALGQAPEIMISGQPPVEYGQPAPASRGLFGNRNSGVIQTQATTVTPLPMPAAGATPVVQGAPVVTSSIAPVPADMTAGPVTLDTRAAGWLDASQNNRSWIAGEFILWRMGQAALPSLGVVISDINIPVFTKEIITTVNPNNPAVGPPFVVTDAQVVSLTNLPATITVDANLPGGNDIDFKDQPGFLIRAGHWFDAEQSCGVDLNFFFMWNRTIDLNSVNNLNLSTGSGLFQSQTTISIPNAAGAGGNAGVPTTTTEQGPEVNITVNVASILHASASNRVWGFDTNLISRTVYFGPLTLDFLGGLRYVDIKQELIRAQQITVSPSGGGQSDPTLPTGANTTTVATPPVPGNPGFTTDGTTNPLQFLTGDATLLAPVTFNLGDRISAENRFYGVQLGLAYDWDIGYGLFLNGFGKVAIGDLHQTFKLNTTATGFLVNPIDANTERDSDRICFVPEFNLNFGYAFTPGARIYAGWNIMHFSTMARVNSPVLVATQNSSLAVGDNSVSGSVSSFGFKFENSKTNLQGLNVGAELRW